MRGASLGEMELKKNFFYAVDRIIFLKKARKMTKKIKEA